MPFSEEHILDPYTFGNPDKLQKVAKATRKIALLKK